MLFDNRQMAEIELFLFLHQIACFSRPVVESHEMQRGMNGYPQQFLMYVRTESSGIFFYYIQRYIKLSVNIRTVVVSKCDGIGSIIMLQKFPIYPAYHLSSAINTDDIVDGASLGHKHLFYNAPKQRLGQRFSGRIKNLQRHTLYVLLR